jgi:hypothetical protein
MIPIAECHGQKGSGDVGRDIVIVKVTAILGDIKLIHEHIKHLEYVLAIYFG